MVKVQITAGICGLSTVVVATKGDGYVASFQLETQCANWQKVNEQLAGQPIDMLKELFRDRESGKYCSTVMDTALGTIPHLSCPVISGILKALEVSVGLAIAQDAAIQFVE
nr:hypothetical protein [uncultured Desulfobulbus sp.]